MTTYTTGPDVRIWHATPSTLTLSHDGRNVTITANNTNIHDLFEMFHAALVGVGFVSETYHDIIEELAEAHRAEP